MNHAPPSSSSSSLPPGGGHLPPPPPPGSLTYGVYLEVEELLKLQKPRSNPVEHDEMLFIVIHQVYELWFKLILQELDKTRADLMGNELFAALSTLRRVRHILKVLVAQLDVLETMTPLSFNSFRSRLDQASGFQSHQFREFEFMLGHKRPQMLQFYAEGSEARAKLEAALAAPTIVDALYVFLSKQGLPIPSSLLQREQPAKTEASADVQRELIAAYRSRPDLVLLLEALTDIDEGVQEWRYRHIKMVERTIGNRVGTGGSSGADYLKSTLFKPLFPDLWAIRNAM